MWPPGCKIIVHENTGKCGSWLFHGAPGFYIGPFMNGYRTYKVYIPNKRAEQSADTVRFFPKSSKMLFKSTANATTKAVDDIGKFWKPAQATPIEKIGDGKCAALQQLVNIFAEKKEMKWCEMKSDPRVKNSGPESAPIRLPWLNPFVKHTNHPNKPPSNRWKG